MAVSSFSGLASGLDTATIVKELVKLERAPITRLEKTKAELNSVSTKFTNFKDLLGKLRDAAAGLKGRGDLLSSATSTSDDKKVTVTAEAGATLGNYEITVGTLASAQRNQSEVFSARNEAGIFASGELTIQVGSGEAVSVTVDGNTTLDMLVSDINRKGAGVTASVLHSNGEYRVQISGNDTGAANAITFGGSAAGTLNLDAYIVRDAHDAQFELDGLPMTSASNVVSDALSGVSFTLKGTTETDSPITIGITRDNTAIKAKLQGFVDAYNAVAKQIGSEFAYKGSAQTSAASLSGDSALRSIQARLRGLVSTQVEVAGSTLTSLSSIGIRTQSDGTLKIDDTILTKALDTTPEAVSQLLNDELGQSSGIFSQFETGLKDMLTGDSSVLSVRISSIGVRIRSIDAQMSRMELQIDSYQAKITAQFTQMEAAMSRLQNQGSQLSAMMSSLSF